MLSMCNRGLTYCRQISLRVSQAFTSQNQTTVASSVNVIRPEDRCHLSTSSRLLDYDHNRYKLATPSPYKNPGARRHGYKSIVFDGGQLPRGEEKLKHKSYEPKDSWSKKRAYFGQNDYIDILGDGNIQPVDLINAPAWIKGFNGNEMQRLTRRLKYEGRKIEQLYPLHYHQMRKRIKFLNKKYNHYRTKNKW